MNRADILAAARGWIGTPYRHQASRRGVGCDCLGLLRGVWRDVLGPEPQSPPVYAVDWVAMGAETLLDAARRHLVPVELAQLQPGDVVLFRWRQHLPASHCAFLASATTIIHAHEGACVSEVPLPSAWARRISHGFSFPLSETLRPRSE